MINWNYASSYNDLLKQSEKTGKPILLDLHSTECVGCQNLEADVYQNTAIANLINENTLPLRVFTDNPDQANTQLINNHIYIWSPTVQLLAEDGTRYHEWYGAPRQTRYSVGYTKTHHEVIGDLNSKSFLAQFHIALGKAVFRKGNLEAARNYFEKVIQENAGNEIAIKEANYWLKASREDGEKKSTTSNLPKMFLYDFSKSVESFINAACKLPDTLLMQDWKGTAGEGDWVWYTDCLREVFLQIFQKLNDFSLEVGAVRNARNMSMVHAILADFHLSYREFQSVLLGVREDNLDKMPFKGERSLRENIVHCILSEWWAHGSQIRHAWDLVKQGKEASLMPALKTLEQYGEPVGTFETLEELLNRYESLHNQSLADFSAISDDELNAYSKWWEPEPVTIGFRLKRLGWHLRDHKVSLERILEKLGDTRTSVEKFCQLLYRGLAKAEAALIGTDQKIFIKEQQRLISFIDKKTQEVKDLR